MTKNESKTEFSKTTRANVTKEMAKPRMARSAKIAELNLDIANCKTAMRHPAGNRRQNHPKSEQTRKGTGCSRGSRSSVRDLRIENTLTDEHDDDVKLKKGARVEVTVTAEPNR